MTLVFLGRLPVPKTESETLTVVLKKEIALQSSLAPDLKKTNPKNYVLYLNNKNKLFQNETF